MTRPVDAVIEFLEAERARGKSHILLDESARDGLRELFLRTRDQKFASASAPVATTITTPIPATASTAPPISEDLQVRGSSKAEKLASLRQQAEAWPAIKALDSLRETLVFAAGNPDAKIMFVGEAPNYEEERQSEPFVGAAGQKLTDILKAMGISRDTVYLSNIVKFRPATPRQTTNNRKPNSEEMAACLPFIRQEIAIVQPSVIIALGATAAEGLLGLTGTINTMRESWHQLDGIPVRISYHPSYLLQSGANNRIKREVWEDMLAVMEKLNLPISEKQRGYFLKP